jgi:hypothetical protein
MPRWRISVPSTPGRAQSKSRYLPRRRMLRTRQPGSNSSSSGGMGSAASANGSPPLDALPFHFRQQATATDFNLRQLRHCLFLPTKPNNIANLNDYYALQRISTTESRPCPRSSPSTALTLALGLTLAAPGQAAARQGTAASRRKCAGAHGLFLPAWRIGAAAGDTRLAVDAWSDLAKRTRDPAALARATEVAGFARQYERALELASIWLEVEPDSTRARQTQSSLLVLANRLDELAPQLAILLERDKPNLATNLLHLNRMLARHEKQEGRAATGREAGRPYETLPEAHFRRRPGRGQCRRQHGRPAAIEKALLLRPDWETAAWPGPGSGPAVKRQRHRQPGNSSSASRPPAKPASPWPGCSSAKSASPRPASISKPPAQGQPGQPRDHLPDRHPGPAAGRHQHRPAAAGTSAESDFPDKSSVHFFLGQSIRKQKKPTRQHWNISAR